MGSLDGLEWILSKIRVPRSAQAIVLGGICYFAAPSVKAEEPVTVIRFEFPYVPPEEGTREETLLNLISKVQKDPAKAQAFYMDLMRPVKAGMIPINTAIDYVKGGGKGPIMAGKAMLDMLTGEPSKEFEKFTGKIFVNGKPVDTIDVGELALKDGEKIVKYVQETKTRTIPAYNDYKIPTSNTTTPSSFKLSKPEKVYTEAKPLPKKEGYSNIEVVQRWEAPKTAEDQRKLDELIAKYGKTEGEIEYSRYKLANKIGGAFNEVSDNLLNDASGKEWYNGLKDLVKEGKATDLVSIVDGKQQLLQEAINYSIANRNQMQISFELSDGTLMSIKQFEPPLQIADIVSAAKNAPVTGQKYIVKIEGVDSGKEFASLEEANKYAASIKSQGYDANVSLKGKDPSTQIAELKDTATRELESDVRAREMAERVNRLERMLERERASKKEVTVEANDHKNFYTCKSSNVTGNGLIGSKISFGSRTNRFSSSDKTICIAYDQLNTGDTVGASIYYNGKPVGSTSEAKPCSTNLGLPAASDTYYVKDLLKFGGYGKYRVDIKCNGRVEHSFNFYIDR